MIQTLSEQNFNNIVIESDKPVLVDFYADWCGPCRSMAPVLDSLSQKYDDQIVVGKVNVDQNAELANTYGGNAYATSNQVMDDYVLASTGADKQNLPTIAVLFRAAATMEQVHANQLKKLYPQYNDGKLALDHYDSLKYAKRYTDGITPQILNDITKINLAFFLGKQSYLVDTFYETLMKQATMFDNPEMYKYYGWFFRSEQSAFRLFSDALKNYDEAYLFSTKYNVCPLCGNIYIFGDNVSTCTVCGVPSNEFITVQ